jgi:hypothetical protein
LATSVADNLCSILPLRKINLSWLFFLDYNKVKLIQRAPLFFPITANFGKRTKSTRRKRSNFSFGD